MRRLFRLRDLSNMWSLCQVFKSYECVIIVFGEVAADECDVIDVKSMWSAKKANSSMIAVSIPIAKVIL
jgi:hypothetical protein